MKHFSNKLFQIISALFFLTACSNINNKVETSLNELQTKTSALDSLINKELDKVSTLDSLINEETSKVKKLDSIINKNSLRLDSIVHEKANIFQ